MFFAPPLRKGLEKNKMAVSLAAVALKKDGALKHKMAASLATVTNAHTDFSLGTDFR